jgi:hypothetical protein
MRKKLPFVVLGLCLLFGGLWPVLRTLGQTGSIVVENGSLMMYGGKSVVKMQPVPSAGLTGTVSFTAVYADTAFSPASASAVLRNSGMPESTLTWTAAVVTVSTQLAGKVTLTPTSGQLAYGQQTNLNISLDISGLTTGTFTAQVEVRDRVFTTMTPIDLVVTGAVQSFDTDYPASVYLYISSGIELNSDTKDVPNRQWTGPLGMIVRRYTNVWQVYDVYPVHDWHNIDMRFLTHHYTNRYDHINHFTCVGPAVHTNHPSFGHDISFTVKQDKYCPYWTP